MRCTRGRRRRRRRITTTAITHLRTDAHRYAAGLKDGHPFGRLNIPRLGLSVIVVQGTDWLNDLSKGPGHYTQTTVPGLGRTVAIAGHRTTFGAWFRHIDSLQAGDPITSRRRTRRSATAFSTTGS